MTSSHQKENLPDFWEVSCNELLNENQISASDGDIFYTDVVSAQNGFAL